MNGLARRLAHAVETEVLVPPRLGRWGDDHALLVQVRNEIAHGVDHVYPPAMAAILFDHCGALMCELHGLPAPARTRGKPA